MLFVNVNVRSLRVESAERGGYATCSTSTGKIKVTPDRLQFADRDALAYPDLNLIWEAKRDDKPETFP